MIRLLETGEKVNSKDIYRQCFPEDTDVYVEYYYGHRINDNEVVVMEKDGRIVSAMHVIPKDMFVGKAKTKINYIYAVSTLEEYRNKGCIKKLFTNVLNQLFCNDDSFTYLIPSDEKNAEIYKKFGFSYIMDRNSMIKKSRRKKPSNTIIKRKAEKSDLIRLSIFAQSVMSDKYKVSVSKDLEYFTCMYNMTEACGGSIEIFVEKKVIVGYRIWLEDELLEEVLDDSLHSLSWLDKKKEPYLMARILNVNEVLDMLECKEFKKIIVKIEDSLIKANDGIFEMRYYNGKAKLFKMKETKDIAADYNVTIGELCSHIFGYDVISGFPTICKANSVFINDYV